MRAAERRVIAAMSKQYSTIDKVQALRLGMTRHEIEHRVASGAWALVHPGVYRLAAVAPNPRQELFAACLAAGPLSAASHQSAAWMWDMMPSPPPTPIVTVPHYSRPRLRGVEVHRSRDFDPTRTLEHHRIPCTDPLRVATDLAAVLASDELTEFVYAALYRKLVSTDGLRAEIERRTAPGRQGPAELRRLLEERGMIGGPEPSVLEALALRLFKRAGIPVLRREVQFGPDGQYRIDFLIAPGLAVEVDGYVHHWTPEAKAWDEARRNQLQLDGLVLLVYTWRDVRFDARRVSAEIVKALVRTRRRAS